MTAGETSKGQRRAFEDTEPHESDVGVLRAGGEIEALAGAEGVEKGRQYGFIEAIDDADSEAGLRVGHRVRKHWVALGQRFVAFQLRSGWSGRRWTLHAQVWRNRGR